MRFANVEPRRNISMLINLHTLMLINILRCLVHRLGRRNLCHRRAFRSRSRLSALCHLPCRRSSRLIARDRRLVAESQFLPLDDLLRQPDIALRSFRPRIVHQRRLAVAWRLGQPDISGHGRGAQLLAKEVLQLCPYLLCEVRAIVEHG